jgi:hypothetical protein
MEKQTARSELPKFSSPEEEIAYLRGEIARREETLRETAGSPERDLAAKEAVKEYAGRPSADVLEPAYRMAPKEQGEIVLDLAPEAHDRQIEGLIEILQTKGLKNALAVIQTLANPHLEDDFHRFVVQYLRAGLPIEGFREGNPMWRPSHMTLFEVTVPEVSKEDAAKELKHLISGMEQFYAGMLSISPEDKKSNYFSLEIANANGSDEFVFYASVPDSRRDLFEKQIHSLFPGVKIKEQKDDYNIFNSAGQAVGSYAEAGRNAIYPLKFYDEFTVDPLSVVLNSFSKIKKDGEGAAIQFVFKPAQDLFISRYRFALGELKKGVPTKEAVNAPYTFSGTFFKHVKDLIVGGHHSKTDKEKAKEPPKMDEVAIEMVGKKIESPILLCNIRIIASSSNKTGAEEILADLEAAFNQFDNTKGNRLSFNRLNGGRLGELFRQYSWRVFSEKQSLPLSIKELTTIMHFPTSHLKTSPQLKQAKAGSASAPTGLPTAGILLGLNRFRGTDAPVYIKKEDRLRHFYTIGQTGTGKTTLLKNMIIQDIKNGDGVCMIDPHGVDIQEVLAAIPRERYEDVIYFDPSHTARPMALNMLEYDTRYPEQKTFVVNEMLSIFNKLFDMKTAGGPMFEQYFRNSVLLTIENPASGNTLFDVSRVLANKAFRDLKLGECANPIVSQFWREVAEKAGGEAALANIVPYITSKFDNFLANDIMRPIIAQEKSSFNFREIMDGKKILLVNLAKGRLGDINSHLIGLILVGKILMAALSRVDSVGRTLPEFYLYIDEFQNVTTDSIATILSEARKYRLSLNVAHQFIAQLADNIKDAVFGNVGSIAAFRVGADDAEYLEKQFAPVFSRQDIINLDNHNAYLKLLVDGRPVRPFSIETMPPAPGNAANMEKLKELSYLKFGRERSEVEAEILGRYGK